ncbi:Ankyrin repeat [Fusarium oxysporum f. sp. vasinfectum]|uniref:Uncharacterized protein n=1 Tax=Fusarium oxysporum f. sp. vasinfectum 25433 TaxID=1089449 RepID=X0KS52_FUSOX|nr:hypothetical protein FOTG_15320 [Fusarium oxysporum f. sp. vasinfectum 25433]KAK2676795.1 Ankyrin repeat [Fusarium oxysporum f. sp. vasinfectum]KAK2933480.1 Ankyrin repeat [Fusarium oxysporum f. sp. vasinfectum]
MSASAKGHVDIVKLLFGAARLNTIETDNVGRTVLFLASRDGRLPMVQYLLSTGRFNLDTKNFYGSTALSAADSHCEVVELLITASASTQEQFHVNRSLLW